MHILLHELSLFYLSLRRIQTISAPRWISKENTPNATIQQFTSAKISVCALKQGTKPHSSLSECNYLQLQNQAAVISCRIHADCSRAQKACDLILGLQPPRQLSSHIFQPDNCHLGQSPPRTTTIRKTNRL